MSVKSLPLQYFHDFRCKSSKSLISAFQNETAITAVVQQVIGRATLVCQSILLQVHLRPRPAMHDQALRSCFLKALSQ